MKDKSKSEAVECKKECQAFLKEYKAFVREVKKTVKGLDKKLKKLNSRGDKLCRKADKKMFADPHCAEIVKGAGPLASKMADIARADLVTFGISAVNGIIRLWDQNSKAHQVEYQFDYVVAGGVRHDMPFTLP